MAMERPTERNKDLEGLHSNHPETDEANEDSTIVQHDAVFGTFTEDGPNYRNVGWIGTSVLMMKCQIGIGLLSIPGAFDAFGLIPGVLCLLAISGITLWSNHMVGVFKINHPEIYGIDDAAALMFGPIGREVLGTSFALYMIFVAGSGMLSMSIGLNAISTHGACTAIFVAVAAIGVMCLASVRTLSRMTFLAWAGLISLLVAIFTVTIAVGIQDRPDTAPQDGTWKSDYKLFNAPSFADGMSAISTIVLAYAGTPTFFPFVAEMRDPHEYSKALIISHAMITITYVTSSVVIYYYCGTYVASPALGSAGRLVKQISYGIALPGLLVGATLCTHVAGKHFFVRILRGSHHLTANTLTHWATWLGCTFTLAVVAYIIASGIPVFSGLVSLIGALMGTLQTIQPYGCMWLYDNWSTGKEKRTTKWMLMVFWSVLVIVVGSFVTVAGTYGSVVSIINTYKTDGGSGAWSCADNSNST